ncbi:MAG TPA: hypothetical protein DIT65_01175 [Cryomorphaceae bacterium]|nr:hypothetical protein [Cryomorphaceae bacterium]
MLLAINTTLIGQQKDDHNIKVKKVLLYPNDSIRIARSMGEKIDDRNLNRHKSGFVRFKEFGEIKNTDAIHTEENYFLIALKDRYQQYWALTLSAEGKPIEGFLLSSQMYYTGFDFHEFEARRYSPSVPYYFDPIEQQFEFSSIFKVILPDKHSTLIDNDFHLDETNNKRYVQVDEDGHFKNVHFVDSEPNFVLFDKFEIHSSFFEQNTGFKIAEISERESLDTIKVFFDLDQTMNLLRNDGFSGNLTLRFISKEPGTFSLFQRFNGGIGISGDGDFCDIQEPDFQSVWRALDMSYDIVDLYKYTQEEQRWNPNISIEDFKELVLKECGDYHYSFVDFIQTEEQIQSFCLVENIILKVVFSPNDGSARVTKYLVFVLANSC